MVTSRKIKIVIRKYKAVLVVFLLLMIVLFVVILTNSHPHAPVSTQPETVYPWSIRSIDTMKTSRDNARDELYHPEFDKEIRQELTTIKNTGANYVAIDTPYDTEFLPYLQRWVDLARQAGLRVWFRGNWSNWEGWFGYPKNMTPTQHIQKSTAFITAHPDLFKDGDIFDPCPECENAGYWPQPEKNQAYLAFLRQQQSATQLTFDKIGKQVQTNIVSVIGGRAKDMFDQKTVAALHHMVSIDHYFSHPQSMTDYVSYFAGTFQAKVIVSEFGAPIPDLNGDMTEQQQADFIHSVFERLYEQDQTVIGINYYVLTVGTTSLLNTDGTPRLAYEVVRNYFTPAVITGTVTNSLGEHVQGIEIQTKDGLSATTTDSQGKFTLLIPPSRTVTLQAGGNTYTANDAIIKIQTAGAKITQNFTVTPKHPSLFYNLRLFWKQWWK